MPKIQLETGQVLEFENTPTPEDIDSAVAQLKATSFKNIKTSIPSNTEISASKKPLGLKPMTIQEQAKVQNIGAISRISGERISDVAKKYEGKTPETGLKRTFNIGMYRDPTTKQLVQGIADIPIKASIGAGMLTNPIGTGVGLAAGYPVFKGLDIASQKVEESLPEKTPEALKELVGTGGYLGSLYAGGKVLGKMESKLRAKPRNLAQEASSEYRDILRPTQGEVKNIEIRKGKNIDDYYMLAAEEQLPIKQTSDKKLDTSLARQKLQPKIEQIHDELNLILETRQNKFNLNTLATKVKFELSKSIKNAKELKDAKNEVDNYVNAEIERYGNNEVLPSDFNNIKQGMWSISYNKDMPIQTGTVPRKLGFVAKEMIESAYPNKNIRGLNELSGKYSTLKSLLENAQGRVIQGGKLGKYFAQTTGALAGGALGNVIPIPGVGAAAGVLGGRWAGGKIAERFTSPERLSKIASKKALKAGIVGKSIKELIK